MYNSPNKKKKKKDKKNKKKKMDVRCLNVHGHASVHVGVNACMQ
jgi:hypothetical protein